MKKLTLVFAATALVLLLSGDCFAQRHIELIPGISVAERYDDNVFLDNTNEQSDFITAVSPSLALNLLSQYTELSLGYTPTFVRYSDFSQNDTTRHRGTVSWDQKLTQYLSLDLSDTYVDSEDPLEDFTDLEGQRGTRNEYWVNQGDASVGYAFGEGNLLRAGYYRRDRENTDPTLNDSADQRPFAQLTYWFNVKNGVRVDYAYRDVELSLDDDYTGHAPGVRYLHRFRPQSIGYVGYTYTTRDFDGITENYVVHNAFVGLDHAFSPEYSVRAEGGYFVRVPDISERFDGPSFSLALTREFARGSITVGVDGGWDEVYLDRGRATFREYYSGSLNGTYRVLESVSIYGRAYYRNSNEGDVRTINVFRGNTGVRWSFMRWFALSLQYDYAERTDDIILSENYTDNRVMLVLSASRPFKW
jgi:hypothetical protein